MSEKTNDNMNLWNAVCRTAPSATKSFKGKGGFKGTAICAQSQRKTATEQWGPFGDKWGLRDDDYKLLPLSDDPHDTILAYTATLYYPGGDGEASFGVFSDVDVWTFQRSYDSWVKNNDSHKKVRTDALTKGLSELGFNSDVFEGLYDDSKYVQEQREAEAPPKPAKKKPTIKALLECIDGAKDEKGLLDIDEAASKYEWKPAELKKIAAAHQERHNQLKAGL